MLIFRFLWSCSKCSSWDDVVIIIDSVCRCWSKNTITWASSYIGQTEYRVWLRHHHYLYLLSSSFWEMMKNSSLEMISNKNISVDYPFWSFYICIITSIVICQSIQCIMMISCSWILSIFTSISEIAQSTCVWNDALLFTIHSRAFHHGERMRCVEHEKWVHYIIIQLLIP
jgi:hypothetical protein